MPLLCAYGVILVPYLGLYRGYGIAWAVVAG